MGERGSGSSTTPYLGKDAYGAQRDDWAARLRSEPQADQWMFTTRDSYIWWGEAAVHVVDTINTTYLMPLRPISRAFSPHEFRLRVTTLGGGGVISAAMYVYRQEEKRYLYLIPQTAVSFDASTTGVKTAKLEHGPGDRHAELFPSQHYFMGFSCNSATVRFLGIDIPAAAPVIGMREIAGVCGAEKKIDLAATSESAQDHYPHICFLNDIAAEIF